VTSPLSACARLPGLPGSVPVRPSRGADRGSLCDAVGRTTGVPVGAPNPGGRNAMADRKRSTGPDEVDAPREAPEAQPGRVAPGGTTAADATPTTQLPAVPDPDAPAPDAEAAPPADTAAAPADDGAARAGAADAPGARPADATGSPAAAAGAVAGAAPAGQHQPRWAAPVPWQPPTYAEWEARHARPTPSGALRRAVTGVPLADWVRDAAAALLLLASLTALVDFDDVGGSRVAVVAVTLLALAALVVPYVVRGGAFGARVDGRRAALVRAGLALPYVVTVLVFVLRDLLAGDDPFARGGVGIGLGVGLAGALLAVAPRAEEVQGAATAGPGRPAGHALDRAWFAVPVVVAAVSVVWAVGSLVAFLAQADTGRYSGTELFALVLHALVAPTVLALGAIGVLRRDEGWRLTLGAVAAAPIALVLLAAGADVAVDAVETVHVMPAPGVVLWPAVAAAAWAVSTRRAMRVGRLRWADAAARVLVVAIVAGAMRLLVGLLLAAGTDETALWLVQALLAAAYVALAALAWVRLRPGQPFEAGRMLAAAAVLALLGLAATLVLAAADVGVQGPDLLLAVVLPVALAGFVLAHASHAARGLGSHPAFAAQEEWARQQWAQQQWAAQQAGQAGAAQAAGGPAGAPAPPAPASSDAVRMAQDPATPQATLADLATRVPETRVHVARHPAAYPALLDWLDALGDPEVSRAVAERRAVGG